MLLKLQQACLRKFWVRNTLNYSQRTRAEQLISQFPPHVRTTTFTWEVQSLLLSVVSIWAELCLQGNVLFPEMCFVSLSTVPSRLHCSCPQGCSGSRGCPSGGLQGEGASLVELHDLVSKTSGMSEHQHITCTQITAVCQHYKGYACFTVMVEEMCCTEDPLFVRAMRCF